MRPRILVIGGSGHVGGLAFAALDRDPTVDALSGGRADRSGGVRIDLCDPGTFPASDAFDAVVNCADTHAAPPDALAAHVAHRGGVFIDTAADTATCRRLLDLPERAGGAWPGLLVVGAGAMPGISNVLAAEVVRSRGDVQRLELFLSWSVLSAAGPGTVDVMARGLSSNQLRYASGRLIEEPPIGRTVRVPIRGKWRIGFETGFPESWMLGRSLGVPSTATVVALSPGLPRPAIALLRAAASSGAFSPAPVRRVLRTLFGVVRGRMFRSRSTSVVMLAAADRTSASFSGTTGEGIRASDAFAAAGVAAAAFAKLALAAAETQSGAAGVEELCRLDPLLREMERMGGLAIERFRFSSPAEAMA